MARRAILLLALAAAARGAPAPAPGPGRAPAACNAELFAMAEPGGAGGLTAMGEPTAFANGTVAAYIRLDDPCSAPLAVGVELKLDLANLPAADMVATQPPPPCMGADPPPGCPPPFQNLPLDYPGVANASFSPFTFMGLNYNPEGHPPISVYNVPHFDFHFWIGNFTEARTQTFVPGGPCAGVAPPLWAEANAPINETCFPAGGATAYANLGEVVPFQGNHLLDTESPELLALAAGDPSPAEWVQPAFIYGGWGGVVSFLEPMVRVSFLAAAAQNATRTCYEIPGLPERFAAPGFYPTQFCIDATARLGTIYVELTDFVAREGGCEGEAAPASYYTAEPGIPPVPAECVAPSAKGAAAPAPAPKAKAPAPEAAPAPASAGARAGALALTALAAAALAA